MRCDSRTERTPTYPLLLSLVIPPHMDPPQVLSDEATRKAYELIGLDLGDQAKTAEAEMSELASVVAAAIVALVVRTLLGGIVVIMNRFKVSVRRVHAWDG